MIISFGHKFGSAPTRSDKVFDTRELTHDTTSPEFLKQYEDIVTYGRQHPGQNISIGCEMGHHRSVVLANKVATALRTSVYHRDKAKR